MILLGAGEPNTALASAHSWLGPIKPSSFPHKLCIRAVKSADVPPPAFTSRSNPGQYSLDPSWLSVFSIALMISLLQACVPVSFCTGGMLISDRRGGCCDPALCQEHKN